ncbi:MAG TPA: DNA polymerase III subunit gamma/tau, partial [Planctomycetota bacterium]|nr:DNA polymerase III subunit gamma/tau [Planctomycetota bacterium]
MSYQPFALKYRPQTFGDLVGQGHVAVTLRNSLREGRVANAFLFTGSRGTGKTSTARILAKALDCPNAKDGDPCNVCEICRAVSVGEDLDVLEIDGASNRGIDEIRRIRDNVSFLPARARFKIYIIDEVHMLTTPAFNALLKTLEEPPPHVKFIFATTESAEVPETIVSRCQRYDFRRITADDLVERLRYVAEREGLEAEPGVFEEIARKAEGGLRDTMGLLDQAVAYSGSKLTLADLDLALGSVDVERLGALIDAVGAGDPRATLGALDEAFSAGRDAEDLLEQLLEALRDAMAATVRELPPGAGGRRASLVDRVRARFDLDRLLFALRLLLNVVREIKLGGHGRLQLETALLKLARSVDLAPWPEILARLERGES